MDDKQKLKEKWERRYADEALSAPPPARVLSDNAHLLPRQGKALDLACGLGGNALFLAKRRLKAHAWDFSPAAIEKLKGFAREANLSVQAEVVDVETAEIKAESFDVVVVSRFLERKLIPSIMALLKPEGLLFYQTFTRQKVAGIGPQNPQFLLRENELLALFSSLTLLAYREEGRVGDLSQGLRNEAYLVGQKR